MKIITDYAIAVMNYTEMEAKVREATNNEPWGASSSRKLPPKPRSVALY
jgi:hypothetical protein